MLMSMSALNFYSAITWSISGAFEVLKITLMEHSLRGLYGVDAPVCLCVWLDLPVRNPRDGTR